ncbi:sulfotransferase 1C2-like [Rhipicephalus sanguineus]|uniref:sulfotransferase 1C2-like n=1 Tax=Rhipicephalus sanguineus TaxID=34632 RepID=UPI001895B00B|nr:sulfotransferase 1C2-like [Rhipicephalus sanguineus]
MVTNLSMYAYEDATFEEFVDVFVGGNFGYGDYFEHVASAYNLREEPNVLFVTYEEMTKNTREVLLRVARFLGKHYGRALAEDESLVNNVLDRSNAEYMRDVVVIDFRETPLANSKQSSEVRRTTCKKDDGGGETRYSLVRTAKVGEWKEYFTPALLKRMEERIREAEKKTSFMDLWKDIRTEAMNSIGSFFDDFV